MQPSMSWSTDATERSPAPFNGLLLTLVAPSSVTLTKRMDAVLVDHVGDPIGQIFASEAEVVFDRR